MRIDLKLKAVMAIIVLFLSILVGCFTNFELEHENGMDIFTNEDPEPAPEVTRGNNWRIEVVESEEYASYNSMDIDSKDNIHISYLAGEVSEKHLKYANFNGQQWAKEVVDDNNNVGMNNIIAVDSSDRPHIAYFDFLNMQLRYTNFDGNNWNRMILDDGEDVGRDPGLAIGSFDNVHISYHDTTTGHLKYTYFDGFQWHWDTVDDSGGGGVGLPSSIDVDGNNMPHISYIHSDYKTIKYAKLSGSEWNVDVIDHDVAFNVYTSICLDGNNHPHIAYADANNKVLKYKYFDGITWHLISFQEPEGNEISYVNMVLDSGGKPHITYSDKFDKVLKYVNYDGASWHWEVPNPSSNPGSYSSIKFNSKGVLHISYYDLDTGDLELAIIDNNPPTLNKVSIISNNQIPTLAKPGDIVTLEFSTDERLKELPIVSIAGKNAIVEDQGGNTYQAFREMQQTDPQGQVQFTIDFTDLAGNAGQQVSSTTDSSTVNFDSTAPTLYFVQLISNNTNLGYAKVGDQVTLEFMSNEPLGDYIKTTINGEECTVEKLAENRFQTFMVMDKDEDEGSVDFTIEFIDMAGNPGDVVTTTTDGISVIFDKTAPSITDKEVGDNTWLSSNDRLYDVDFYDKTSGLDEIFLQLEAHGSWISIKELEGIERYSEDWSIPKNSWDALPEGETNASIRVTDRAGNDAIEENALLIRKDTIGPLAPTITVIPSNWTSENDFTIIVDAQDALSGLDGYYYSVDDSHQSIWFEGNETTDVKAPGYGEHKIYISAKDKAGNKGRSNTSYLRYGKLPSSPVDFEVELKDNVAMMTWDDPWDEGLPRATEYRIWKGTDPEEMSMVGTVGWYDMDSYRDYVSPGQTYYYYVTALNPAGDSPPSDIKSVHLGIEEIDDTDGDGVTDVQDSFPDDPAASQDTDYDGMPDDWNPGYDETDSTSGLTLDSDDDNDKIPDSYELLYSGMDPKLFDSHLDLDNDGHSNYKEYVAVPQTDPTDASDNPDKIDMSPDTDGMDEFLIIFIIVLLALVVVGIIFGIMIKKQRSRKREQSEVQSTPVQDHEYNQQVSWKNQEPIPPSFQPPIFQQGISSPAPSFLPSQARAKCAICLGNIKQNTPAYNCKCRKTYHPNCIGRTGPCPFCGISPNKTELARLGVSASDLQPVEKGDVLGKLKDKLFGENATDINTFVVNTPLKCGVCYNTIMTGKVAIQCSCARLYHMSCGKQVGECPSCSKKFDRKRITSLEEKASKERGIPRYPGMIRTATVVDEELPRVVTTSNVSTPRGAIHLYNMLLAKKGIDLRLNINSDKNELNIARKKIISNYHPDRWQKDKDKATFFTQKVNLAWETLSRV